MKKKIYKMLRKHVARIATGKLGKVEILEDEIICYVDGRKLKKKEKYLHRYNLIFKIVNPKDELYKIYKVDKPVHYIVKDALFDMEVNIMASMKNCHVTFENCTFTAAIEIDFADHLTFKNNIYRAQNSKNYNSIYKAGELCISTRGIITEINKLEFINNEIDITKGIPIMNINELLSPIRKSKLQLWLYAKEVILINTDIENAKSIIIGADTLTLNNTSISAKEIEIDLETVLADPSTTVDSEIISVENNNKIYINKINAKSIFINGVEVNKNKTHLDSYDLEIQKLRLELINTLKKIKLFCEETISEEIKKQSLTRVLKK